MLDMIMRNWQKMIIRGGGWEKITGMFRYCDLFLLR